MTIKILYEFIPLVRPKDYQYGDRGYCRDCHWFKKYEPGICQVGHPGRKFCNKDQLCNEPL